MPHKITGTQNIWWCSLQIHEEKINVSSIRVTILVNKQSRFISFSIVLKGIILYELVSFFTSWNLMILFKSVNKSKLDIVVYQFRFPNLHELLAACWIPPVFTKQSMLHHKSSRISAMYSLKFQLITILYHGIHNRKHLWFLLLNQNHDN